MPSFATTYICWLRRKLNDWIILSDVLYLKYATALPSGALSVIGCQAAVPLDSDQAKMKNEPSAVHWPQPSQCHWIVLFINCSGKGSEFLKDFPPRNAQSHLKRSTFPQYLSAGCYSLVITFWLVSACLCLSLSLHLSLYLLISRFLFTFKSVWQKLQRQKVSFLFLLLFCIFCIAFLSFKFSNAFITFSLCIAHIGFIHLNAVLLSSWIGSYNLKIFIQHNNYWYKLTAKLTPKVPQPFL